MTMKKRIESISAGEFKAKCLQLMDEVQARHKEIVITKRGKPIAKLVPYAEEPQTLYGCMKGSVTSHGNIIDPIEDEWQAHA